MRDERAAVASSIVPDDEPEPSGRRAKSLTPQRWKSPFFARVAKKPSSFSEKASESEEATATGVVARRDGVAAIRSDPSGGTDDDGRDDIPLTSKIAIASDGRHLARKKEEVWWEHTDERSGRKYYSNGTISMWGRPADVDISAAATSSSSAASDDRSRVETASSNLVETLPTSPTSMEKRDQQGPSAEKEKSKSTTQKRKKFKMFVTKEKASQALATFSDAGEFRLALSGTIGNSKIDPNCPRQ
jgi:hypothetical protein